MKLSHGLGFLILLISVVTIPSPGASVDVTAGATCTASSEHDETLQCSNVFNDGGDWATMGEGVGAWIEITLAQRFEVTEIMFQARLTGDCLANNDLCESFKTMELQFDNGETRTVELVQNLDEQRFPISPPVSTKSVKIVATAIYTQRNNGFARISFSGSPAVVEDLTVDSTCTASSEYTQDYLCSNVFNDGGDWATKGEGVGAWIEITLPQKSEVTEIMLQARLNGDCLANDDLCESFKTMELQFDNGETRTVELLHNLEAQSFPISPPVQCNSVKIVSTAVYTTYNNGFSRIVLKGYPGV